MISNESTYFLYGGLTIDKTLVSTDNVLTVTIDMQ